MKIPGFSTKEIASLEQLVAFAKADAQMQSIGAPVQGGDDESAYTGSLLEAWDQPRETKPPMSLRVQWKTFAKQIHEPATLATQEYNLEKFKHVSDSSSASTFKVIDSSERPYALRVSSHTKGMRAYNERTPAPHQLQSCVSVLPKHVQMQLMPWLPFLNKDDEEIEAGMRTFHKLMKNLYEDTVFDLSEIDFDLGVLPDGTMVFIDPSCFKYKEDFIKNMSAEEQELAISDSIQLVLERSEAWDLPEQFRPMNKDMTYKQFKLAPILVSDFPSLNNS